MGGCCSKGSKGTPPDAVVRIEPAGDAECAVDCGGGASADSRATSTESAVRVVVVVRPQAAQKKEEQAVEVRGGRQVLLPPSALGDAAFDFAFDRVVVASSAAAAASLYAECVRPVVERFCAGYNASIIAYGQTGAGKTHQMSGGGPSSAAVIPQACRQLLAHAAGAASRGYAVQIRACYVEVYNESIIDLLAPAAGAAAAWQQPSGSGVAALRQLHGSGGSGGSGGGMLSPRTRSLRAASGSGSGSSDSGLSAAAAAAQAASAFGSSTASDGGGLSLRENARGEVVLEGATEVAVHSEQEIAALLERGGAVRATAAHRLNTHSSRSHAIFTITMQQRALPPAAAALPQELRCLQSKLRLVDLAGSERAKETGTTGARFSEGVSINSGLLALGNVIQALSAAGGSKPGHVPYRNSKLTRLLQDSLGGNSETLFCACIAPGVSCRDHTISTLRYASRASHISNRVSRVALAPEEELAQLRQLVAELQAENARLREQAAAKGPLGGAAA